METKTIADIKEADKKFGWETELRETSIPIFEITLPDYIRAYLSLDDGDQIVFSETKSGEENAVIMKRVNREL